MRPAGIVTPFAATMLVLSLTASAATPPTATQPKPATAASGTPPLTKLAMAGQGSIKESIRTAVDDKDIILRVNWPSMAGQPHTCTLYSITKQDVDPLQFMALMKTRPDAFMYLGVPAEEPDVTKGARYVGQELDGKVNLVVTGDSPCCFMLKDASGQKPGAVVYGAFRDGAGELWVYEESLGSYFTDVGKYISIHNDQMAPTSQKYLHAILNIYLDMHPSASGTGSGGCPAKYASNYKVDVNHHVDTGIKVA
ncbi:MAG: hypothetical protein ACRENN_11940, partial [Candidatus Eiseniibacteriota bacterium]